MNQLQNALNPQPIAPPGKEAKPEKPKLDFKPMVEQADKDHETNRGGLSASMVAMIQATYAQEAQQKGTEVNRAPKSGLNPGWGGEGR